MTSHYYLEGYSEGDRRARRYDLTELPTVIGREEDCQLQLNSNSMSRQHARFDTENGQLTLTDLGSTNGTFVNRQRIEQPTPVQAGYILHFGNHEFRLMAEEVAERGPEATRLRDTDQLPNQFPLHTEDFFELLREKQVRGFMQVITTSEGTPFAYELLGRGSNAVLGESPGVLFKLAETLESEVALSQLFRQRCFEDASLAGLTMPLFFNTHPEETRDFDTLLAELQRLKKLFPQLNLVFEVHEAAITDLDAMAEVRRELDKLNIGLAYDDFGAGQTRLLELVDVPPDYLKFDITLVRNLRNIDSPRYQLLNTLNTMISGLGIRTLAEGIETEETAELCRTIGIDYFQGFLFGRPQAIRGS